MNVSEEEDNIVKKLKHICYPNGKEKKPSESADLFHGLGRIYRQKSPDKIALIQSATLLNGALVRKPGAPKIESSLSELCDHVLNLAQAEKKANLVGLAANFKKDVVQLRRQVKEDLNSLDDMGNSLNQNERIGFELRRIDDIYAIQEFISATFSDIMKRIAEGVVDLLGPPPCQYALVGMGSLAKREVTPYSDFECIIILEDLYDVCDETNFEYFRWFAVVFQIILINLGETLIPNVAVPTLNNSYDTDPEVRKKYKWFYDSYTPSGISFDGMVPFACKSPLGRQQHTVDKPWKNELIKPVSEMLKYLTSDEDLKNGYHLADMLTKTCFVQGNPKVYDNFHMGVLKQLEAFNQSEGHLKDSFMRKVVDEFREDYDNFNFHFNSMRIQLATEVDVKKFVYRSPTLAVASVARYHGIHEVSCHDMLDKLVRRGVLKSVDAHRIKYAIAVSCELRQKFYSEREAQNDNWTVNGMSLLYELNKDAMKQLEDKLGKQSLVKCLETGVLFQEAVRDHYRTRTRIELKPSGVKKLLIHAVLGLPEEELKAMIEEEYLDETGELKMSNDVAESVLFCFALVKIMPESTYRLMEKVKIQYIDTLPFGKDHEIEFQIYLFLAEACLVLNKLENCIEFSHKSLAASKLCDSYHVPMCIPSIILTLHSCHSRLGNNMEAYEHSEKVLWLLQHADYKSLPKDLEYMSVYCKAQALVNLKLYEDAIDCLKPCIEWRVKVVADAGRDNSWLDFQACLWNCYFGLNQPEMYTKIAIRMFTGNASEVLKSGDLLVYVLHTNALLRPREAITVFRKYKDQLRLFFRNGEKPVHRTRTLENMNYITDPGTDYFDHTFGSFLTFYGRCHYVIGEDSTALRLLLEAQQQFLLESHANPEHIQLNNRLISQCSLSGIVDQLKSLPILSDKLGIILNCNRVEILKEVTDLMKDNKYQTAYHKITQYRKEDVIKFDDIDTKFIYHLAVCFKEFNRFHDAVAACQKAIAVRQEMTTMPEEDETLHSLFALLNECHRKLGCSPVKTHVFSPLISVHAYNRLVFQKQKDEFRKNTSKIIEEGIRQYLILFGDFIRPWITSASTNSMFSIATLSAAFTTIGVCLKLEKHEEARVKIQDLKKHLIAENFYEAVIDKVEGMEKLLLSQEAALDSNSTRGTFPE